MRNLKRWKLIQSTAAVAAWLTFTGCETSSHDERSEGRAMDDKQITENVQKELKRDPVYKFENIDAVTFGAVVQLSGFVNTEGEKSRAEEIARQIQGVHQVVNGIALKPEPMSPTGSTNAGPTRIYSE